MVLLDLLKLKRRRFVAALVLVITITGSIALFAAIVSGTFGVGYGQRSCVVIVQPTPGVLELQQGREAAQAKDECFSSLAEAVSYATDGAVSLPRNASAAEISAALRNQE